MPEPDPSHDRPSDDDAPPAPPASAGRGRVLVPWILIALLATAFVWGESLIATALPTASAPDPVERPDAALELSGKVLVGSKVVLGALSGSDEDQDALNRQFRDQLEDLALPLEEIASLEESRRDAERARRLRALMIGAEFTPTGDVVDALRRLAEGEGVSETLRADAALAVEALTEGSEALTEDARDRLVEHHGWIGRLLATHDVPRSEPRRAEVLAGARNAFLAIVAASGAALLALLAGLALLVTGMVLLGSGKIRRGYRPDPHQPPRLNAAYTEVLAIFLAGFVVIKLAGELVARAPDAVQALFAIVAFAGQWLLLGAALWPLARGESFGGLRRALGWHAGRGVLREVGAGVVGYVAGLPIVAVGFLITILLILLFDFQPSHPIQQGARDAGPLDVLILFSVAALWAPIVEETIFRGAIYHALRRWTGAVLSALGVGFVFAAIHPQGISTIPALMALAFVFAMMREWRGSLIAPMVAHALHNAALVTLNLVLLA